MAWAWLESSVSSATMERRLPTTKFVAPVRTRMKQAAS